MVNFTRFVPTENQTDVARTTVVSFTIDDATGANRYTLAVSIDGYTAISDGYFVNSYTGNIFSGTGKYVVGIYPKAPDFIRASANIAVHMEIEDSGLDSYDYNFYTYGYNPTPVPPLPDVPDRLCSLGTPFFPPTDLGLVASLDAGTGTEATLSWKQAYPYDEDNVIFYNLYYSTKYTDVFVGDPGFLIVDTGTTIGGLTPGDTHYFAVRVTEFDPLTFTYSGMQQAGSDMYFYPETIYTSTALTATDILIYVDSVVGFPNFGILKIGTELVKYSSVTPNVFSASTRGALGTLAAEHDSGTEITLYIGNEGINTNISQATTTFQKPNYSFTNVSGDGYGYDGYRDGYDGYASSDGYLIYKETKIDSITTDGTANDASGTFPRFDYCGTWRSMSPYSFMKGQCRSTYFGGVQVKSDAEGNRHLVKVTDVQTHMLQREELLLETTGEPMVLLRRMWTGKKCLCYMQRRQHPDARCPICFNTSFTQGYIQVFNPRRSDRRILVRIEPAMDDLSIVDRGGFEPLYEPDAWTIAFPQIKDRDMLIRFNENGTEDWRFEILNVTRNKVLFTQTGAQKFKMKRLLKTDIIYQYPVVRTTVPYPETIQTSISSTTGIASHYHELVVPQGVNLLNFKGATLEAEGHNHIIYNGVIQNVLNHTHTL
jgi:hypothetical protein